MCSDQLASSPQAATSSYHGDLCCSALFSAPFFFMCLTDNHAGMPVYLCQMDVRRDYFCALMQEPREKSLAECMLCGVAWSP